MLQHHIHLCSGHQTYNESTMAGNRGNRLQLTGDIRRWHQLEAVSNMDCSETKNIHVLQLQQQTDNNRKLGSQRTSAFQQRNPAHLMLDCGIIWFHCTCNSLELHFAASGAAQLRPLEPGHANKQHSDLQAQRLNPRRAQAVRTVDVLLHVLP